MSWKVGIVCLSFIVCTLALFGWFIWGCYTGIKNLGGYDDEDDRDDDNN